MPSGFTVTERGTNKGLRVCQLNCGRSKAAMWDLGQTMASESISIALLQEPYVINEQVIGLPSNMRVAHNYKAAVVINDESLEIMQLEFSNADKGCSVWLKGPMGELIVVSVYFQFGGEVEEYLEYLNGVLRNAGATPVVIGADLNAVSPRWYSKYFERGDETERRGEYIAEWLEERNLNVFNVASDQFTFSGPNGESDIDVTMGNEATFQWTCRWEIRGSMSDHNLLMMDFNYPTEERANGMHNPNWNIRGVDWQRYGERLHFVAEEVGMELFRELPLDIKVIRMEEWFNTVNESILIKQTPCKRKRVSWWNSSLGTLRARARKSRRRWQAERKLGDRDATEVLRKLYNDDRSTYTNAIKKAKDDNFRKFVEEKANNDPWGEAYKFCRGKRGRKEIPVGVRGANGQTTKTWDESVGVLLAEFFPPSRNADNETEKLAIVDEGAGKECEWEEVNTAVKNMKLRKAPGHDGIKPEMVKVAWRYIPEYVMCLMNDCIMKGCFPERWKIGKIVVLKKAPDKPREDPRSYRPICLLPVMGKLLERIMISRLEHKITNDMFKVQYGFRRGKSTEDAWLKVKDVVENIEEKYALGIFVDFKGAFDNMEWDVIKEMLLEMECDEYRMWESYFSKRKVFVEGVNDRVWKRVRKGCPQGSIGGPHMWILVMERLLKRLSEIFGVDVIAYADDLLIIIRGVSRKVLEEIGCVAMRMVAEWGQSVGVEVSENKTVSMLLKGSLSVNRPPNVRMLNKQVRYVKETKYLGVTLGERMNFKPHLVQLHKKVQMIMGGFKRVLKRDWGLGRKAFEVWYKGMILACVGYAVGIWGHVLKYDYGKRRIISAQRIVLYAYLRVCRTVSTEGMQVLAGFIPWDLEMRTRTASFMSRMTLRRNGEGVRELINDAERTKEECIADWQTRWDASEKGREIYEYIRDVEYVSMNQWFFVSMHTGFLLTGHGSMNDYLFKRGLEESTECVCGKGNETRNHIIQECELYDDLRENIRDENGDILTNELLKGERDYMKFVRFASEVFGRRKNLCA